MSDKEPAREDETLFPGLSPERWQEFSGHFERCSKMEPLAASETAFAATPSSETLVTAQSASAESIVGCEKTSRLAEIPYVRSTTVIDTPEVNEVTVLIADDEAGIRSLVGRVLRSHGYKVLEAADGVEALELAAQYSGPIHLLLTDVCMPRLDGRELCGRLKNERPETRILFMSGSVDTRMQPNTALLRKPFDCQALVRTVNEALKFSA